MHRLAALLLIAPLAASATPVTLQYQARVTDAAGAPLQGPTTATFTLYVPEDGIEAAPWDESIPVDLDDGYFSVVLGEAEAINPDWLANDDMWLSVEVLGASMAQSMALSAVPYAIHAAQADGLSGDLTLPTGSVAAGTCTGTLAGTLRYADGSAHLCNGSAWVRLATALDGSSPSQAVSSCEALHTAQPQITSSVRWVDFDGAGGRAPVEVFCDMDTRGGGWMVFARVFEENNAYRYGFDSADNGFSETADTFVSIVGVTFDEMAFIRRDTDESRAVALPSSVTWPAFGSHANNGNGYTVAENPDFPGQYIRAYDADTGKHFQLCFRDSHNDECGPASSSDPGNYGDAGGNDDQDMLWDGNRVHGIGTGIVWDFAIR